MTDLAQALSEIKSLPDHALQKELSSSTGMLPGFLILSELHDRKNLRSSTSEGGVERPKSLAQEYAGSIQPYMNGALRQALAPQSPMPQQGGGGLPTLPQGGPPSYASGGIVSLASGGQVSVAYFIRQIALGLGIDPNIALKVAASEGGLSNPFRHGEYRNASG